MDDDVVTDHPDLDPEYRHEPLIGPPNASVSISKLAGALAQAQLVIDPPTKNKVARIKSDKANYEYKYASLDDVIAAIRQPLADNHLSWMQEVRTAEGSISVWTTLLHDSGEWVVHGPLTLGSPGGAQQAGAAITYARRYALQSMLGVAAEPDDDAVGLENITRAGSTSDRSGKATEAQMKALHAVAKRKGVTHDQMRDWAGRNLGIESLTELTKAGASRMRESLDGLPDAPDDPDRQVPDDADDGSSYAG